MLFIPFVAAAQTDQSVMVGTWQTCTKYALDSTETCTSDQYFTYKFRKNGKYTTGEYYEAGGKKYEYKGTWSFDGTDLVMMNVHRDGSTTPASTHRVKWLNETLFYSTGSEREGGPLIYQYFKKKR
jgi:hypothetical protein